MESVAAQGATNECNSKSGVCQDLSIPDRGPRGSRRAQLRPIENGDPGYAACERDRLQRKLVPRRCDQGVRAWLQADVGTLMSRRSLQRGLPGQSAKPRN